MFFSPQGLSSSFSSSDIPQLANTTAITHQCYCGKYIRPASKFVAQKDCGMACGGNKQQWCGGNGRVSIFNMTTFAAGRPPATVGGSWAYQSCYMEP